MKKFLGVALAGLIALVAVTFVATANRPAEATGNHVNGSGNPTCADLGLLFLVKRDPPTDGVEAGYFFNFSGDGEEVDISDAISVPGTPVPFDKVIVKGGSNSNYRIYTFNEATSANDLETGTGQDISHVTLCYDEAATATPTNTPTATATFTPVPTDTPEPTATPTDTATATPTDTATPEPTATDTPEPTATNTPEPTATPTCQEQENCPTATPTDEPRREPSNTPTRTATPVPPTSTPTATPTGEVPVDAPSVTPVTPLFLPDSGDGTVNFSAEEAQGFFAIAAGFLVAALIVFGLFALILAGVLNNRR